MYIHMSRIESEYTTTTMNESTGGRGRRSNRSASALLRGAALIAVFFIASSTLTLAAPTPLTLINGWKNAPFGTSAASVEEVSGIVHFKGAISSGTSIHPFTLPAQYRPATNVYVPVDLCNAHNGRLFIQPNGTVTIQAENGTFSNAQCFTSLDGASFAPAATAGFVPLTLINNWTNAPFGTSNAAIINLNGTFHFKGAIASGSNSQPFSMPPGFFPLVEVYIPIDLCNATKGRLHISLTGTVNIEAENGAFSNAQCFTSLDGAWFTELQELDGFQDPTLINGWTDTPFTTSPAAVGRISGVVYFRGAMVTSGSNAQPFTLPSAFRPVKNVYVPIDLCNATKGRLFIQPSGAVTVQAENGNFSNAQCFTSLDGASFVQ
jgi:hypothetical protein